jgi:single stranded DNA-binding protein
MLSCYTVSRKKVIYVDFQRISVSLIGNATKDAEVKAAKESGKVYGDFTVAVKDRQKETHFFPVRCFGKLAESVRNIRKGAKVFVDGALEIASYTDKEGKKQMSFRVLADTYRILSGERRTEEAQEAVAE